MQETTILFPIAPSEVWKQISTTVQEVVTEKLSLQLGSPINSHLLDKALLKATDVCRDFTGIQANTLLIAETKNTEKCYDHGTRHFLRAEIEAFINGRGKFLRHFR